MRSWNEARRSVRWAVRGMRAGCWRRGVSGRVRNRLSLGLVRSRLRGGRLGFPAPFDAEANLDGGFFDVQANNDTNRVDLFVFGNAERFVTVARLDNLGKGASGAAIQCMNLNIGAAEDAGLKR